MRSAESAAGGDDIWSQQGLWERVFSSENMLVALKRVERNKGAAGVDGLETHELRDWLREHWTGIRIALDAGTYAPLPVRQVMIPKPDGGQRMLGVPSVLDRLIQQALAQVLSPVFDPGFVPVSYGFRPGKSAHDAVKVAQLVISQGYRWVVEVDLEAFFDRVNHDVLMSRVARKVKDQKVLKLVRRYLEAGIMAEGVRRETTEGTPQGSPLSPLLSNIILDDFDQEFWGRGHRFVRYADDLRIFVKSKRAAIRVLEQATKVLEGRLKLRVNQEKSTINPANVATLLGFRVLLRQRRGREDADCSEGVYTHEGQDPTTDFTEVEYLHGRAHSKAEPIYPGLDGLFSVVSDTGKVRLPGSVVQAEDAADPLEGMEESAYSGDEPAAAWNSAGTSLRVGHEQSCLLADCEISNPLASVT